VKDAIATEAMSIAGRINVLGMTMVFAVVAADGVLDVIQALVRIWRPGYSAGNPPLLILLLVMCGLTLCCVLAVGLVDPLSLDRRRSDHHRRRQTPGRTRIPRGRSVRS